MLPRIVCCNKLSPNEKLESEVGHLAGQATVNMGKLPYMDI